MNAAPDTLPMAAPETAGAPATEPPPPPPPPLKPVAAHQRIEALDVVRGFALVGIFLMNIEWFNRPFSAISEGIPREAQGLEWLANFFVNYFVQGKFWTIFSLLFGMGFAVMLQRADGASRPFIRVYLRRLLALAVFGASHFIFLWEGDILFSYAVGAALMLIVLYGRAWPIVIGIAAAVGVGVLAEAEGFYAIASGLATAGALALYLRSTRLLRLRGARLPVFSALLLFAGAAMSVAAAVFWLLPDGPIEPRLPMSIFGPLLFITGWLSWKYHEPVELRSLRMAVSVYVFAGVAMTMGAVLQHLTPDPAALPAAGAASAAAAGPAASNAGRTAAAPAATTTARAATPAAAGASKSALPASAAGGKADKPKKTREERAAEMRAEREKRLKERAENRAEEIRVFTTGTWLQTVDYRARRFLEKVAGDFGFGVVLVAMFLLGSWFVRSGVMADTAAHLPLFRRMARPGLPIGIGLGLVGALIATAHTPGDRYDGWGIARGLMMLGSLPACLGYVGLVVTMLHGRGWTSGVRVLAPAGRMALTNYLTQSLICTLFFYGYGLGHWGMSRVHQLLFVAVVYAAQIAFSHWWLARFRYGPMEWLWRGFTYREVPPLRIAAPAGQAQAA